MTTINMLEKGQSLISAVTIFFSRIASVMLVCMMLLISLDVVSRSIFNKPVQGTFELVEVMMGVVVSLSIAYCGLRRAHVAVELFAEHFPAKFRKAIEIVHHIVCVSFFIGIAYKVGQHAFVIKESETVTALLEIPIYPFLWILSFGAALLALVYFFQLLELFKKELPK